MNTKEKIFSYIKKEQRVTANKIVDQFALSRWAIYKHLNNLLKDDKITKVGKPPKVFYLIKGIKKDRDFTINKKNKKIIEENYLIITPNGERKNGLEGFVYWCDKNNLDIKKTITDYIKTIEKYNRYKKQGLIKGNNKFKKTFSKFFLDDIYYLDFYSIEKFGKTKLGQLLLYGKQSGDRKIIKEIIEVIKPKIEKIIKLKKIDAVGFIPWTVKREVQIMRELEKGLKLDTRKIKIEKIKTEVIVPQKTLKKIDDRIENAEKTIILTENTKYNNILLIDDAVGSGSTLNETAKQIREKEIAKKVIGVAITGSFKGFDVISEV